MPEQQSATKNLPNGYAGPWESFPEVEGLPNNFRTAVTGREMGVNRIRWVHPTVLPEHVHDDSEQALMVIDGRIKFQIGDTEMVLAEGDVAIVPRGVRHGGRSIENEAVFLEVFAPTRIENLVGFLGGAAMPASNSSEGDK